MAEAVAGNKPDLSKITSSDIIGLWEVIRIDEGEISIFPWIRGRFLFNFLDEVTFVCYKEWKQFHGTWELSEKTWESEKRFLIKLNETFEYMIVNIDEDEMIFTDRGSKYILARKL